jgi:hypothetical protein
VARIQGSGIVFAEGEVQGLDAQGRGVCSVVRGGLEFGAAEAGLDVGVGGSEDGCVAESYFYGDCGVVVELWVIS